MSIVDILDGELGPDVVWRGDDPSLSRHRGDVAMSIENGASPAAVARPRTTAQVAAILKRCNDAGIAVTPQGGLTGLVGGAVPTPGGLALSLERMRAILEIDRDAATLTAEAGVTLEAVQVAASEAGFVFPLDLGARGSCTIGGNVSTNAGGNRVLRYGMMRDLVLGVEAVLADGTVVSALNKMLKNNAGYDVKQLFVGSEGTLGVVTKVVLRLFPKQQSSCTALCGVPTYSAAMELLARCRRGFGASLSAYEMMWPDFYELACELNHAQPMSASHRHYVLLDLLGSDEASDELRFGAVLERALADNVIGDAVIARSTRERAQLWSIRECIREIDRALGANVSFDVSIPPGQIGAFVDSCDAVFKVRRARAIWFGHVADSNVHLKVAYGENFAEAEIEAFVYERVRDFGGSVSAEHGIGIAKRSYLAYSRSPAELEVMRRLKFALDPNGILNPGKVMPA